MQKYNGPSDHAENQIIESAPSYQTDLEYQREILEYITDIGVSLRLPMNTNDLLKRVADAICHALHFRYAALYLANGSDSFKVYATSGLSAEQEAYLQNRPLPADIVALLVNEQYRLSDSYFIPAEAPIWQNETIANFFLLLEDQNSQQSEADSSFSESRSALGKQWDPKDLFLVPLISAETTLLGFITPDAPLDGLRPTAKKAALLELFANQAAVVIEGARLYEETRQSNEERAVLIEIGRLLSSPQALTNLQTIYHTLFEQVNRLMPVDAFFISHYFSATDKMTMEYLIDEGVVYPPADYKMYPHTRRFLRREEGSHLFSTTEEYLHYLTQAETSFNHNETLVGNKKHSASFIFVPICYGNDTIGILSAQSYQPNMYNQRHVALLEQIGVQVAIAITNSRLYSELRDALKLAQESERLKNHFLMTASHELRTPLTAIQGYLELLGSFSNVLDETSKTRFINSARRACEELVLLLSNVMDTSRIDQDRVSLTPTTVKLAHAVSLILEILEPTLAREKRMVQVNVPDELQVWADDLRLRQILLNLVGNALKYTPSTSPIAITATVSECAELSQRLSAIQQKILDPLSLFYVVVAVRDWGPGISAEDQTRLFTKFMRLDSAMNSIQRGAGLGLYLCRQLSEAMGGQIWLESSGIAGEGSTFYVALPQQTQ